MIFLTVGTQFTFERLIKSVDQVVQASRIKEEIYAQIGNCSYRPSNFRSVPFMRKDVYDQYMNKASCVISHAGMGTIMIAMEINKPLLVMPRQQKYGEVVNDHQVALAWRFEQMGHILVAYDENDLFEKIGKLQDFVPRPRNNNSEAVVEKISHFLNLMDSYHNERP